MLVSAQHLASLFIGLSCSRSPVYGMVAYAFFNKRSLEAGIKYTVLSAAGSAFPAVRHGPALRRVRYSWASPAFGAKVAEHAERSAGQRWRRHDAGRPGLLLSLVPFHLWTPDVHEGAPGAGLGVPRHRQQGRGVRRAAAAVPDRPCGPGQPTAEHLLSVIAVASILFGNLLALTQSNIKRLLGYSSIAHLGYLLVALIASWAWPLEAVARLPGYHVLTSLPARSA